MADTITHTWQTVEQAAVTLNVSTRTIARRIAGGTIESRVDENGRRLVLVEQITNGDATTDGQAERQTADVGYDMDENALAIAAASAIAKPVPQQVAINGGEGGFNPAATSVLTVLQSTIDAARDDAHRARTGARWAWAGVAFMAVVIGVGGFMVTQRLTRAETKVEMLQDDVSVAKTELDRSRNDLLVVSNAKAVADQKREAAEVQLTAAEAKRQSAEAELVAAKKAQTAQSSTPAVAAKPTDKAPGTQPNNTIFGRLVNLPLEPDPH